MHQVPFFARRNGQFFRFRAFAVERRLIDAEFSRKENAVRGEFFSRFEQDDIAHHQFGHGNRADAARALDAAFDIGGSALQFEKSGLAAVLGKGGNERR